MESLVATHVVARKARPSMASVCGGTKTKSLSDHVIIAFHRACDHSDLGLAKGLLDIVDSMQGWAPVYDEPRSQHDMEILVGAHQRLWNLRN
jgi:hypothetical protein